MSKELVHSITRNDLKLEWFSGTGKGGQHRNKHQNCLRLTHLPTNTTVVSQDHRERPRNLRVALERLAERLRPWIEEQVAATPDIAGRSDTVLRTYNQATNRVVDLTSGAKWSWDDFDIGDGIDARRAALAEKGS